MALQRAGGETATWELRGHDVDISGDEKGPRRVMQDEKWKKRSEA